MTDSTDDIADVLLEDFEKLQDDCKWLGVLLDDCLRGEGGEELFKKTERIRNLAGCASQLAGSDQARLRKASLMHKLAAHLRYRAKAGARALPPPILLQRARALLLPPPAAQEASALLFKRMAEELAGMSLEEAAPLTRALGHYLGLTSIAELHHKRVRRRARSSSRRRDVPPRRRDPTPPPPKVSPARPPPSPKKTPKTGSASPAASTRPPPRAATRSSSA